MKRWHHLLALALLIGVTLVLGWASQRFALTADWTQGNRASLTPASQRIVAALDAGPIQFTAFVTPGAHRDEVRTRLERYLRASNAVRLTFVDPAEQPARMQRLGIDKPDTVRVTYQGRSENLQRLREPIVSQALQRLAAVQNQWLVFLTGHGERHLADSGQGGYSKLAAALDAQGLVTRKLNLAQTTAIPDNTAVLVIASPQTSLLPGEINMIGDYVAGGGNLLWLADPGSEGGLSAIASSLGIRRLKGTLIYPDYRKLGTNNPAMTLVANYPDSAITERINRLTLFPLAGALTARDGSNWQAQVFLRSATRSWLETQPLERGTLTFQPDQGDREGPLAFGYALTRSPIAGDDQQPGDNEQRAVVIADSDFLSNGFINTLGNHKLGMAIFQWLAQRDAQIAIDVAGAPDATLQLAPATTRRIGYSFVVLLPLALLIIGIGRWAVRRRR